MGTDHHSERLRVDVGYRLREVERLLEAERLVGDTDDYPPAFRDDWWC
jgi:hypothetical protein